MSARAKEEAARIVATGAAPQTRSQLRAQRRGTLLVASIHPRSVAALPRARSSQRPFLLLAQTRSSRRSSPRRTSPPRRRRPGAPTRSLRPSRRARGRGGATARRSAAWTRQAALLHEASIQQPSMAKKIHLPLAQFHGRGDTTGPAMEDTTRMVPGHGGYRLHGLLLLSAPETVSHSPPTGRGDPAAIRGEAVQALSARTVPGADTRHHRRGARARPAPTNGPRGGS